MRSRLLGTRFLLGALFLVGTSLALAGCAMPFASKTPSTLSSTALVNQAIFQLQAALGLPDGAVTRSTQPAILGGSDVALRWQGGTADVDVSTGRIRAILVDSSQGDTGTSLSSASLDDEANRLLGLLGWDSAAIETQGFTPSGSKTVDYADVGTIFEKSWQGHDLEGLPNEGVIELGLDASTGALHSFLYSPGPQVALDMSKTISKDAAIKLAQTTAAKTASATTSTDQASTTSTTAKGSTTATTSGTTVASATLIHTDKPGITGGKNLLVWEVKLGGDQSGNGAVIIYIDANSSKVLLVLNS